MGKGKILGLTNIVRAAALVAACFVGLAPGQAAADDDPDLFRFAIGWYDINDDKGATEFRAEYQSDLKLWFVKPFVGVMGTSDGAFYGYGGFLTDLYFGRRIVVTPSFAVGGYHNGNGKDLGNVVEFRSSIELAYRFDDRSRLGISFYHLSNASLSENNQGTEILSLSYAIPLNTGWWK
jgi:hypothetical protein